MRCKNCGSENDDNRYICENCGSPLYDDGAVSAGEDNSGVAPLPAEPESDDEKAVKKNAVIIAVLAVILIAVIISIIVVAHGKKDENQTSVRESTSVSTTVKNSTTEKTTKEETTEETTESTTKEETTTTTKAPTFRITAGTKVGGSVEGGGTFKKGETVVLKATPEEGYEFAGWYSDGVLKSSAATYKFEAAADGSYTAVFNPVATDIEQHADAD